eukprot:gene7621-8915_t
MNSVQNSFVCEKGGLDGPYIEPTSTSGGIAKLLNKLPVGFNYAKTNITLKSTSQESTCPLVATPISPTDISCTMPKGTGSWNVSISDGTMTTYIAYTYQPPQLQMIYPGFNINEAVTIIGQNFGDDPDLIKISVSRTTIDCENPTFLTAYPKSLTCTLASTLTTPFFDVKMTVNDINTFAHRTPVHVGETGEYDKFIFYSCTDSHGTFDQTMSMASSQTAQGLIGQAGIIDGSDISTILSQVCQTSNTYADGDFPLGLWMGAVSNKAIPGCVGSYYNNSQPVTLYNPSPDIDLCGSDIPNSPVQHFTYNMTGKKLQFTGVPTDISGMLTMLTIPIPNVAVDTVIPLPTTGGMVTLTGVPAATFVPYKFTYEGEVYSGSIYDQFPTFDANEGCGGPIYFEDIQINGVSTRPGSKKIAIQYNAPSISNVTSMPTSGSDVTLNGNNFYTDASSIKVKLADMPAGTVVCPNVNVNQDHVQIICTMPAGYGKGSLVVDVCGQDSQSSPISYLPPTITSLSSNRDEITLVGTNFYTDPAALSVVIGSYKCENIVIISNHTTISCKVSKGSGTHTAKLTIGGQIATSAVTYSFKPYVEIASSVRYNKGGIVTIQGGSFADGLTIQIGGADCINPTAHSDQLASCYFAGTVALNNGQALFVNVTVDGISGGEKVFLYTPEELICPGNPVCSNHGKCVEGQCQCESGWDVLRDCSESGDTGGEPTTGNNGTSIYPGKGSNFTTSVTHLREITPAGVPVTTLVLADATWTLMNGSTLGSSRQEWSARFANSSVSLLLVVSIYSSATTIDFAGEPLDIAANSIKYTVTVEDWQFAASLNSLQVIYSTRAQKQTKGECSDDVETSSQTFFNEYTIVAGDSILRAKFAGRLIADGRILYSKVVALDAADPLVVATDKSNSELITVMTAIVVPHFTASAVVDPSFRSLIKSDDEKCGSKNKWRLPVIVVCSVAGAAIIVAAGISYKMMRVKRAHREQMATRLSAHS